MKPKNLLSIAAFCACVALLPSCKKAVEADKAKEEIETTFELSTDQAIADNLTEDANDIFMEAAVDNNLTGQKPVTAFESMGILGCANITITPMNGFPKTISVDFGGGCISPNGIARKGKINIVLSDSVRKPGSTAVLTFDNYFVTGYKKEGIITWTNTSTVATKGWQRKVENGKITSPTGKSWLHSGIKDVVQTAGYSTPRNLLDDAFSITGNHTVTNMNGVSRTSVIIDPLQKQTICDNISQGTIQLQGPSHNALVNFGNGTCDKLATISIDGGITRTIFLR
jgi:hypothetical protein